MMTLRPTDFISSIQISKKVKKFIKRKKRINEININEINYF